VEDTCSLNESIQKNGKLSSSCLSKYNTLSMEVSCTNPWGWTKQKTIGLKQLPCQGCFAWHPLQHAAMVAIEKAAERDRMLFTSSSTITKPMSIGHMENDFGKEPAKRLKTYSGVSLSRIFVSSIF
jgi:tRNA-specific adenosine deaminase 3